MHRYIKVPSQAVFFCLAAPFKIAYHLCLCCWGCLRYKYDGKPMPMYCGNASSSAMAHWERQKVLKNESPKLLPKVRKRALTIPDVPLGGSYRRRIKATNSQLQSTLFGKFPLEIRERMYMYTLASAEHVHIYRRADRRLGHYGCSGKHHQLCPPGLSWGYDQTLSGAWDVSRNPNRERDDLLSILMTCRRAYVDGFLKR